MLDLVGKEVEHAPLVRSSSVLQAERHRDVAECAEGGKEGGGMLVGLLHGNLVIARVCLQEEEKLAPGSRVYDLIDTWERERVLGACLIEPHLVNAHPPTPIFFLTRTGFMIHIGWCISLMNPNARSLATSSPMPCASLHQNGEAAG
jgi:hypothetical protein